MASWCWDNDWILYPFPELNQLIIALAFLSRYWIICSVSSTSTSLSLYSIWVSLLIPHPSLFGYYLPYSLHSHLLKSIHILSFHSISSRSNLSQIFNQACHNSFWWKLDFCHLIPDLPSQRQSITISYEKKVNSGLQFQIFNWISKIIGNRF